MDSILGDLPRVYVYIDDILVASETPEQHLEDLKKVFQTLSENGLVVQRSKCILGRSSLEFLGYHVDQTGVKPLPHRVEAIRAVPAPTTLKELQRFLGMVNYYRRFIRKAAHHLYPLFGALQGPKRPKGEKKIPRPKTLNWTEELQTSFDAIKEALAVATLLHHPRPNAPLALTTDASKFAIGGVLEQEGPNGWEPLSFYSAKLQDHQTGDKWPAYDRELLAMFKAVRHFRPLIEGHAFTIFTDQQALVPSMNKKSDPLTARQTYQLACVSEYTTDIRYIEGKANVVADTLSRPPGCEKKDISAVATPEASSTNESSIDDEKINDLIAVVNAIEHINVNLHDMARDQTLDPDYIRLSREARSGLNFKKVNLGDSEIIVDVSNGPARPIVPYAWRRRVFDAIHGLGHPGVERTRQAVCAKFVWPSIRQDVSRWARECQDCQRSKIKRHTVPPIGEFTVPKKRFQHWNIDIVTLPSSNGYRHLLTAVDRLTRWPLAIPMKDITASTVIDAFTHGLIATFGIPQSVTTDNGSQFQSAIWQQLMQTWGIQSHFTTPYHPQSNGLVERFHRRLKEALNALVTEESDKWYWKLPCVLLAIRTTMKPDINASPADLVFGEGLAIPGEILSSPPDDNESHEERQRLFDNLRLEVARVQPTRTSAHRRPAVHIPEDLRTATHVFVRRGGVQPSLTTPYVGPYRVINREESSFRIAIPGAEAENINIARLKPAIMPEDGTENDPPSPPRPGRRPRPPRNPPPPSDRQTRQSSPAPVPPVANDPLAFDPGEGTSAQARTRTSSISSDEEDNYLSRLRRLRNWGPSEDESEAEPSPVAIPVSPSTDTTPVKDPHPGHVPPDENLAACPCDPPSGPCENPKFDPPRRFTARRERTFSNRGGPVPSIPPNNSTSPQQHPRPPRQFSNPQPGNFSYRRRRPDVNAFFNILTDHLSL